MKVNDFQHGEMMEEDIPCLRSGSDIRRRRSNLARTPTAVVSDVFGFLNEIPLEKADDDDADDKLTMSDVEVDQLFSNLDMGATDFDEAKIEDCANGNLLFSCTDQDRFLAEYKSKDSGFASLERQRCEPSSLYDSFLENDDDTEDAIESFCNNDIFASISESLYDDVDVSTVPRSISMEAKSTCVDDETENAIASSAEKFGADLAIFPPSSEISGQDTYDKDVADKTHKTSKHEVFITVVMVNKPSVEDDSDLYSKSHQITPTSLEHDGTSVVISEGSSDSLQEYAKSKEDNGSVIVPCDGAMQSLVTQKVKAASMFDFVIEPDKVVFDSANIQSDVANHYKSSSTNNSVTGVDFFEFEGQDRAGPVKSASDVDVRAAVSSTSSDVDVRAAVSSTSSDVDVRAAVSSTSSDDDDHVDEAVRDCTVSISDQAYDTIDVESHGNGVHNEVVHGTEGSLSYIKEAVVEVSSLKEADVQSTEQPTTPLSEKSPFNVTKRNKLEKNLSAEMASDDSSDEDVGIYAESFRRSNWVRLSREGKLELTSSEMSPPPSRFSALLMLTEDVTGSSSTDSPDGETPISLPADEEVFTDSRVARLTHKRTDSMTTTASESEFKYQYVSRRKCLIQRADSQQEYHRLSSRVYDQDKQVIVHRTSDSEDLGLHLLDSHPAFITSIDPGSAAEKAGLTEGQILVSVNDQNVLTTDHGDIVELIHSLNGDIKLGVANSDFQPVRDLQATVMSGYMYKLGNSAFKMWNKRFFILRQDNCLYYYKNEQEHDPLGALPLGGYTISRHTETSKDFCFKAEKYGGRSYYFIADNRDQMTEWVGALTEAAARSKKRKESFLSVSSHNVGLPALHIVMPECAGFLGKLDPSKRTWRRRYCVLKDACVYYYKDKSSVSALGVAHLHGYTVDVENCQRRKSSFTLQPPEKKMRVFYFSADNETDKKRWVESLIHSIQRWVRVDKEAEC